jgi:cofilin
MCRAPDTARTKAKMMYASTKDYFKGHLDGLSVELQASETDEITEQEIEEAVRSVLTRS